MALTVSLEFALFLMDMCDVFFYLAWRRMSGLKLEALLTLGKSCISLRAMYILASM